MCIFRIKPLNTKAAAYSFFVNVSECVCANAFDCAYAGWFWHKRSHAKRKLTRNEVLIVKLLQ